jgi:Acetyltransferases, including N-acetylases of ribosomal proteins
MDGAERLTPRLRIRRLTPADAGFIVELLNQPDFLRHIGDRGVRDEHQANGWLRSGPLASYARDGSGLHAVELRGTGTAIGICGLLQRDWLPAPDLGFAYLPAWYGQGYAREAAEAMLEDARACGIGRVLAIVSPDNERSTGLLRRLGMREAGTVVAPHSDDPLLLFETPGG